MIHLVRFIVLAHLPRAQPEARAHRRDHARRGGDVFRVRERQRAPGAVAATATRSFGGGGGGPARRWNGRRGTVGGTVRVGRRRRFDRRLLVDLAAVVAVVDGAVRVAAAARHVVVNAVVVVRRAWLSVVRVEVVLILVAAVARRRRRGRAGPGGHSHARRHDARARVAQRRLPEYGLVPEPRERAARAQRGARVGRPQQPARRGDAQHERFGRQRLEQRRRCDPSSRRRARRR